MPLTSHSRAALLGVFRGVPFPTPTPLYIGLVDQDGTEIQGCDRVAAPPWSEPVPYGDPAILAISNAEPIFFDLSKVPAPPKVPAPVEIALAAIRAVEFETALPN